MRRRLVLSTLRRICGIAPYMNLMSVLRAPTAEALAERVETNLTNTSRQKVIRATVTCAVVCSSAAAPFSRPAEYR